MDWPSLDALGCKVRGRGGVTATKKDSAFMLPLRLRGWLPSTYLKHFIARETLAAWLL